MDPDPSWRCGANPSVTNNPETPARRRKLPIA